MIETLCAPLDGRRMLDIGCGAGQLLRALAERGAQVAGVDADEAALEAARSNAPSARLHKAGAGQLPFADASVHVAVFLNSLHHIAAPEMLPALAEAARVVGTGGSVIVVEPLSEGTFFDTLLLIEDETAARHAAQDAILRATRLGFLREVRRVEYERIEAFADAEAFVQRAVATDPARNPPRKEALQRVLARFETLSERDARGYLLRQPLRLQHLKVPIKKPPPINPLMFG